jgi:hypothetical protein
MKNCLRKKIIGYGLVHAFVMLVCVVWASMDSSVLNQGALLEKPWFLTTLLDLYLTLAVVYIWIHATTKGVVIRLIAFLSFILLGNIGVGLAIAYRAYAFTDQMTWTEFLKGDLNSD